MVTKAHLEDKLAELKKHENYYNVAVSSHERNIDEFKRGIGRKVELDDRKYFALMLGDLKILNSNRDKIREEIIDLQTKIRLHPLASTEEKDASETDEPRATERPDSESEQPSELKPGSQILSDVNPEWTEEEALSSVTTTIEVSGQVTTTLDPSVHAEGPEETKETLTTGNDLTSLDK